MDRRRSSLGLGILTAIASSLCCVTPLLVIIAGSGSLAASFRWLEPLRPWLIGFTVLALGVAWYTHLVAPKTDDCNCDVPKKRFWHGTPFLGGVTLFALAMLSFPAYGHLLYPQQEEMTTQFESLGTIEYIEFNVTGMTCAGCEAHVEHAVQAIPGVKNVEASYKDKSTRVAFDAGRTNPGEIRKSIEATKYVVGEQKTIESFK